MNVASAKDKDTPAPPLGPRIKRVAAKAVRFLLAPALIGLIIYAAADEGRRTAVGAFLLTHLGFPFWALLIVGVVVYRVMENKARRTAIFTPTQSRRTTTKPLMQPLPRAVGDWVEIVIFRDSIPWRVAIAALTVAGVIMASTHGWTITDWPFALASGDAAAEPSVAILAISGPLLWFVVIALRLSAVTKIRANLIGIIHGIARSTLKYPRPTTRPTGEVVQLASPHAAIQILEWDGLEVPRRFFVMAPSTLSVTDGTAWNEFEENLNAKMPHPEGWHVARDGAGKGALVTPAQYPVSILWDGEQDADPLTFIVGANLDAPGEWQTFTFGETSPHALVTGPTGSGKTSWAEIVMAQAATKPMPWDDTLRATCHVIDPKGPFANRWDRRPQMDVTNGTRDIEVDGITESGVVAMAIHLERVLADMLDRQRILDKYPNLGNWTHLPDAEKIKQKMAPVFTVMDEYLDHTGKDPGKSELVEKENAARDRITYIVGLIARKGRSLGFHLIIIAQDARMQDLGGPLVRQLVARVVLGNMDVHANGRMFGADAVIPVLPTVRMVAGKPKGIPGRARMMNAPGQHLHRLQVSWFGGSENSDTLEKYLPRTTIGVVGDDQDDEAVDGQVAANSAAPAVAPAKARASRKVAVPESVDLDDEDGNGIPDAWDAAVTRVAAERAANGETPDVRSAPQRRPAPAPVAVIEDAPDLDDLALIAQEAQASAATSRNAADKAADPDDDPAVEPEPEDPWGEEEETRMRVVGPPGKAAAEPVAPVVDPGEWSTPVEIDGWGNDPEYTPRAARDVDIADPDDFFGGK